MDNLPKNLEVGERDKTFMVFDPNPQRQFLPSILNMFPVVVIFTATWTASMLFPGLIIKAFASGLALSLGILLIGLNLVILEDASEVYYNSKIFSKAVREGTRLGVGDLSGLQTLKNILPRIIRYYFGLSIGFVSLSVMLPYVWSSTLQFIDQSIYLTENTLKETGWLVIVFLYTLALLVIHIFASKIKNKLIRTSHDQTG